MAEAAYLFEQLSHQAPAERPDFRLARIAIPNAQGLKFFGDRQSLDCFRKTLETLQNLGAEIFEIDFSDFAQAGKMLFEGAFVNERFHSVGAFIDTHKNEVNETVTKVIAKGADYSAGDVWDAPYQMEELKTKTHHLLSEFDFLLVPTTGTIYRIDEIKQNPIELNQNMAYYTNFANLLDLSVIAVPAVFREDGLPFGISLIQRANQDARILAWAELWQGIC